jgi:hypothetical protein
MVDEQMVSLRRWKGRDGRSLDRAALDREESTLREKPLDFFSHVHGLEFDGKGRLWVLGPQGDSAYADVFADTLFLGRLSIGCRDFGGSFALNKMFLAMVCSDTEDSPTVQLYQLREGE